MFGGVTASNCSGILHKIDDNIFVGSEDDARVVSKGKVDAILNVALQCCYDPPEDVEYHKVSLTDDGNNDCDQIQAAVDKLAQWVGEGKKVLVHCRAGVSRSPSIVAAYYAQHHGHTLDSALEAIKAKRPIVDPGLPFWMTVSFCRMKDNI